MAYSTIPAAKAQLLTTLQARTGLASVLVAWGLPAQLPEESERVYIDDAINVTREWAGIGSFVIDEEYTLRVHVEVYQAGDDQRACEERMWQVVAEIEQAAVLDVTLANVLKWGAKPGAMDPKCQPTEDGWLAFVTLNLDCGARLRAS
jgi:hypothetical protein